MEEFKVDILRTGWKNPVIKVTHIPSGIEVKINKFRSSHKNIEEGKRKIREILKDMEDRDRMDIKQLVD